LKLGFVDQVRERFSRTFCMDWGMKLFELKGWRLECPSPHPFPARTVGIDSDNLAGKGL
jgi:hypothetical protein